MSEMIDVTEMAVILELLLRYYPNLRWAIQGDAKDFVAIATITGCPGSFFIRATGRPLADRITYHAELCYQWTLSSNITVIEHSLAEAESSLALTLATLQAFTSQIKQGL